MNDKIHLKSLAVSGYRSFGKEHQYFEKFSKINLFIGANNCGKSNILKLIHEVVPDFFSKKVKLQELDRNLTNNGPFQLGFGLFRNELDCYISSKNIFRHPHKEILTTLFEQLKNPSVESATEDLAWFFFDQNRQAIEEKLQNVFSSIHENEIRTLYQLVTNHFPSGDINVIANKILDDIQPKPLPYKSQLIPAIRKIGEKGTSFEIFDGNGIIEELAKFQNPEIDQSFHKHKKIFNSINAFLQTVLNDESATLEIPYGRNTILAHLDKKTLPLENLGTGIHEVIILAAASTIMEDRVICLEEPELHLHPLLQKKLIRYLQESTKNQYFITTHSAALLDTPEAEIYQVRLVDGCSKVTRVTADAHKSMICKDLGYHPSDLIQSNCIIWVEGPSDRIYLKFWIKHVNLELIEGIHYSIMFYGGRLLSHLTLNEPDSYVNDFISLVRLNRKSAIVIDSDKKKKSERVNKTKKRIETEFADKGFAWITMGREIENYLSPDQINIAIGAVHSKARVESVYDQYDKILDLKTNQNKTINPDKVAIARHITQNFEANFNVLDLNSKVKELVRFIEASNPKLD